MQTLIRHIRHSCSRSLEIHILNKPQQTRPLHRIRAPSCYLPLTHQTTTFPIMSSKQSEALTSALTAKSDYTNTARTFTEPITQAIDSGASEEVLEEKLSSSWRVLIDVAAKTEHQAQEPLIEIAKAIQTQGGSGDEKLKSVTIWGSPVKIWDDMPLLGASMRSAWNRGIYPPLPTM